MKDVTVTPGSTSNRASFTTSVSMPNHENWPSSIQNKKVHRNSKHHFEEIKLNVAKPRRFSTLTAGTVNSVAVNEILHKTEQASLAGRVRIIKSILAAAGLAASTLLATSLASTDFSWAGYSILSATLFSSQVLLSKASSNGISYYAMQVAGALGMGGGETRTKPNVARRASCIPQKNLMQTRRPSSPFPESLVEETISVEILSKKNPTKFLEIIKIHRAVFVSLLVSLYSLFVLSYLFADSYFETQKEKQEKSALQTSEHNLLYPHKNATGSFSAFEIKNIEIFSSLFKEEPTATRIYSALLQRFGAQGVLLLSHVINLVYTTYRLFIARKKGIKLRELVEEEGLLSKMEESPMIERNSMECFQNGYEEVSEIDRRSISIREQDFCMALSEVTTDPELCNKEDGTFLDQSVSGALTLEKNTCKDRNDPKDLKSLVLRSLSFSSDSVVADRSFSLFQGIDEEVVHEEKSISLLKNRLSSDSLSGSRIASFRIQNPKKSTERNEESLENSQEEIKVLEVA